jgi:hypothetical protein
MPVTVDLDTPTTVDGTADGTPTGLTALSGQESGKVTGSAGNDRATLFDVQSDTDQVVKTGAGDDVFVFGPNSEAVDLNGLVFMGDGNDAVYLAHRVEDYIFTARPDGEGIKIQYIGDADGSGDAITFYQTENFFFRNVDPDTGVNYTTTSYSHDALYAAVLAGTSV